MNCSNNTNAIVKVKNCQKEEDQKRVKEILKDVLNLALDLIVFHCDLFSLFAKTIFISYNF